MSPPWTCKFQFRRGQTSEMTGAFFRQKGPLCYIALRNEVAVLDVKGIQLQRTKLEGDRLIASGCRRIELGQRFSCASRRDFIKEIR